MDRQKVIDRAILVIAVVAIVLAAYFYYQWNLLRQNPQAIAQRTVSDLVAKVGRLAVLPTGETPSVATISDPQKLKDQSFFAKAKTGDKVLIYAQAKKAYLYSVSLDRLLEVAPLSIGNAKAVTPPKADTPSTKAP